MFNGGSRKRAMSATLNSISKQEQHHKQQMTRNLVSNSLAIVNGGKPSSISNLTLSSHNRSQGGNRKSQINHQITKSRINKLAHQPDIDDDEELIVDDDFKPNLEPNAAGINLLNSQLFASSNGLSNNNLENDITANTQLNGPLPLNLLSSVSNCHNGNKMLGQNHPLAAFAPFQTTVNGNGTLNGLNNPMSNNCMNELGLLNTSNGTNISGRTSNQNNSSLANINNRSTNNGQLDVVQAMLPMLGQEFIWPAQHPLNSLTQLSSLNNQQHCSPSLPPATHLNTLLPNQTANGLNSFPNKSFPILYNNQSPSSILFAQHNNLSSSLSNQAASFNASHLNGHKNLLENWSNNDSANNLNNKSAFKKVNTIDKLFEQNHLATRKSTSYNEFSAENLSKSKRFKSIEPKKLREDENVDIELDEEELIKKQEISKSKSIKESKIENQHDSNERSNDTFKSTEPEKSNNKRKKANSTNSLGDADSEELSDCGSTNCSPIRSQSACDLNNKSTTYNKADLINEQNCKNDNCQLPGCSCERSSSTSQLIDLSNMNSLIKQPDEQINAAKLNGNNELELVNNIMAINKLNEVMNRSYSNDLLFKEEIEKRIQLVGCILIHQII